MNLALPTLVILCLLLPGFSFRKAYYSGYFSNQYLKSDFSKLIFSVLIPSALLHFMGYWILKDVYDINPKHIGQILSGKLSSAEMGTVFSEIYKNGNHIFLYFIYLTLISGILGWFIKIFVRFFKLDRKFQLFRFQNEWHYLFSGEILDFSNVEGETDEKSLAHIDVLLTLHEGSFIYSGILKKYNLAKNGGLDNIYLTNCTRKKMGCDEKYQMPGNYVVISNEDIKNIHITYYQISIEE